MDIWIRDNLSEILEFPVPLDMTQMIIQYENEHDLDVYLKSLVDISNPRHRQFINELKKRRFANVSNALRNKLNNTDIQKISQKQNDKKKGKSREKENVVVPEPLKHVEKVKKNKMEFVNLYSQEGKNRQMTLLKGRQKCECEAKVHSLVNNCLNCGRIVCLQERAGPCLFCGNLVYTPDKQIIVSSKSKYSDDVYTNLMDLKLVKVKEDPLKHRDKLLEYDRNSARRTEVIDDENDYYQSSSSTWLPSAEREKILKYDDEAREKKYESRMTRKIEMDFAGRRVMDEFLDFDHALDAELRESAESMIASVKDDINLCPTVEFGRPTYIELKHSHANKNAIESSNVTFRKNRIQDKEYLEMADEGFCLSMHQPYASLLVSGIKMHEGRSWYSSHRGRLWIAATSKKPTAEDVSILENRYRVLINENITFPRYPTGCLLGCVTVMNVLSQENYLTAYPDGESRSGFVFICDNPYELPLKFPMKGRHKIYKLDKKIHQAAMQSLEPLKFSSSIKSLNEDCKKY